MRNFKPLNSDIHPPFTMKEDTKMAEPVSSTGVAIAVKIYGIILIALLAWLVVVMTRLPRTRQEWVVSLITTVLGSIAGGAFIIQKYNLHAWTDDHFGALAIGGVFFIAGLPVWAITRWLFNYINDREGVHIFQIIHEIRNIIKGEK